MTDWRRVSGVFLAIGIFATLLLLSPAEAAAQSCVILQFGGCSPPEQPNQCFPDANGPASWTDPGGFHTTQTRLAVQSPSSTCHGPVGVGGKPACCTSFHPPYATSIPTITDMRIEGTRVMVDYEAPNYYCQNTGDWPPFFTCTNDPLTSTDRLLLFINGQLDRVAFIYYEKGSWDTGLDLPCGATADLTAEITFLAEQPLAIRSAALTKSLPALCDDRRSCPAGGGGGGAGSGVAQPINVGSGDVAMNIPFFTLAQPPLSLSFGLAYHSGTPRYPALVTSPLGAGWIHPFAQTLRPIDQGRSILYHLTAEGFESEYAIQADGSWKASRPGELRGRVTQVGSQYNLTDLDGTTTAFDVATGRWLSTTDRWGNSITGAYTGNDLTNITDGMGRPISLAYASGLLTQIVLPDGQTWRFAYSGGSLIQVFDPLHTGSTPWRSFNYLPDSHGVARLLGEMRDEAGVLLEGHGYDNLDRGISSVSEGGRNQVAVEYSTPTQGRTRVTHTIDGATSEVSVFSLLYQRGRFLPLLIDGNCDTCSGASSDTQSFTYDASNFVTSRADGKGHVTSFQHNADGNVISKTEAAGTPPSRTTTYHYDYAAWPNFLTEIDQPSAAKPGAQKVTTMTWNSAGPPETTLTTVEQGFLLSTDTAPTAYTTTMSFETRHRLLSTDGPRTNVSDVTSQTYYGDTDPTPNRRGRLAQVTDPVGLVTTFDNYDGFGTARNVTEPNGVLTVRATDARGRTVSVTSKAVSGDPNEPTDYVTRYAYDGRDRMLRTTFPRGNALAYPYEDGTNRLLDTIRLDSSGRQMERLHRTLNIIGDAVVEQSQSCDSPSVSCPSWTTKRQENFAFDAHNRLLQVLHPVPAGSSVLYTYDPDGLLASVRDENHASLNTRYDYDALDRLTTVTQTLATAPTGQITTSYTYDVMDNLASVTDPNGNVTAFSYDDFRRLQKQISPVTGTTVYSYDEAGNLVSTTDANGAITTRAYDASNRVAGATAARSGVTTETIGWSYDDATPGKYGKGRLAAMTDPSGATAYAYERRGLLRSQARTVEGNGYATGYSYDANGNRSAMTYPSGRAINYFFDFADRPVSAASGATTYVSSATYLPFGPEASLTFGNGTTKTMTYDLRYRPTENKLVRGATTLADYTYAEDPVGNITKLHDATDPTYNRDFTYDDLYRLTGASAGSSLWGTGSYSYDAMGNMTSLSLGSSRTAAFSYSGTLPKLASVTESGNARSVSYDAAGNENVVGPVPYAYSPRNVLSSGDGLSYTYDGRGLRTIVSVSNQFGTITGTVVNAATSAPIAGATVKVTGTPDATSTDASGSFTLVAVAGTATLTVSKPGFLPTTTGSLIVPAGASVFAGTISLSVAPGTITGMVVGSGGLGPLPGATAQVTGTANSATTDASGNFTLIQAAGTYTVTISKAGFTSLTTSSFSLASGGVVSLGTITLAANPVSITGRVVSSVGGGAVVGATVTASGATFASATTDGSGNFSLSVVTGTYVLTISKSGFATTTTGSISLAPGASFSAGTIAIDPLGTITGTVVQAVGGSPIAGAAVNVVGTLNSATTDASGDFTLSQPAGTYSMAISAAGFASATTPTFTLAAGATFVVGTITLSPVALAVYVGYADDLRPNSGFPTPWKGSPNVVFLGSGSPFDAGAIRLDNNTDNPIDVDGVSVNLQRPGPIFNLWGSFTVPSHGTVILTQTAPFNFDTSDFPIVSCGQTLPPGDPRVAKVTVTVGGVATSYFDTGHILDTGGFDLACQKNEALQWRLIGTTGINVSGDFLLSPLTGTDTLGSPYTVTATVTDANGQPLPNVTVTFHVTSGPNSGQTGQAITDALGKGSFTYTGTTAGTDTLNATITNQSGGTLTSNAVTVTWPPLAGVQVFVGYADDLRANSSFPVPWQGAPNVNFLGFRGSYWDAGAIRLDNTTDLQVTVDRVTVDLQRPGPVYSLSMWTNFAIPAHGSTILTQAGSETFDSSEHAIVGCGGTVSPTDPRIPKITVTIGGLSANYLDTAHILDTFGYDLVCLGNESLQWRPVGSAGTATSGHLTLLPPAATTPLGASYTAIAVATDAANEPLPNATVAFQVLTGPNVGKTGSVVTNGAGVATFTYTSTAAGTDTLRASIANVSGGALLSNQVTSTWVPTAVLTLSPSSATNLLGAPYNATALATDGAGQPLANLTIRFQVTSGPNAGSTGQGVTDSAGHALFTYTSNFPGTDSLQSSISLQGGNALVSNQVTATWNPSLTITLAPATATNSVGTPYTATALLVDASGHPVPGMRVNFQILSGPNAGRTGEATTDAAGHARFTYTSSLAGTDALEASLTPVSFPLTSNQVNAIWVSNRTTLVYTGPTTGEYNDPLTLTGRLTETATGNPLSGASATFTLGSQSATGVTNASGIVSASITPSGIPFDTPLTVTFAGDTNHLGSSASALVMISRDDTAIAYTGRPVVASGTPQQVSAALTDAEDHAPLSGETITFTLDSVSVSATTDANGIATATITVPATVSGPGQLVVAFAGDTYEVPAQVTVPVTTYGPASFVLWGGNTPGLALNQRVNFWGSQWEKQVTGGDYAKAAGFKGYGTTPPGGIPICEATRSTTTNPPLDDLCWTSKTGQAPPPASLPAYIGVIVATSIGKQNGEIFGNAAATVVLKVDPNPRYGPDPGKPGYGTIVAVIQDPTGLFGTPIALRESAPSRIESKLEPVAELASFGLFRYASLFGSSTSPSLFSQASWFGEDAWTDAGVEFLATPTRTKASPLAIAAGNRRYFFYSSEMSLLAESELTATATPAILYEYIWFNGHPVAQVDAGSVTHWTFTDHLGTPILQTDSGGAIYWRAEHEPFGAVFAVRTGDQHQTLRLPGQEAEQLNLGDNGLTEREYNVFRWYRPTWGRYTQPDPLEVIQHSTFPFAYANANPQRYTDPKGLDTAGCTVPTKFQVVLEATRCFRKCCALHDACYDRYGCTSASWKPANPCEPGMCTICNATVMGCFWDCVQFPLFEPPSPTDYYCAREHRFIKIPGDFPDVETARRACNFDRPPRKCCPSDTPEPRGPLAWR